MEGARTCPVLCYLPLMRQGGRVAVLGAAATCAAFACGARSALVAAGAGGGVSSAGGGTAGCMAPSVVTFASAPDWDSFAGVAALDGGVSGALGQALGPAREVCLNAQFPAGCPAGALVYGLAGVGWEGGSGLPNARWIWRADVAL